MVTILFWSALAVVCALACAGLLIVAIRQRKVAFVVAAVTVFLVGGYCGFRAVHEILQRSRTKLALALEPRSGPEIYAALFGGSVGDCVVITDHQDQVVPKLDTAIRLRMRTCPAELKRILQQGPYILERSAIAAVLVEAEPPDRFAPALLGDTILRFQWTITEGKQWRTIYAKPDSTEAICVDVLD
ncbi:MAG: hypothetical protein IPN85_07710 [Flavobacteriales bacterium]|nr:hypothetical protein [Flavobacteriales bacterium]MBK9287936.1 hypothetical protein [Flavobacteriales bacterium]MBL0037050.1 hypothetical protein [Flavobacteriales bacterium]